MIRYKEKATTGGTMLWLFQRITGVYLAAVLFIHILNLHVLLNQEITFDAIAGRVATPLWKTIDISFLIVALFHGLYGLWIVLDDYIHWGWARVCIFSAISIVALVFTILGVITLLPFQVGG